MFSFIILNFGLMTLALISMNGCGQKSFSGVPLNAPAAVSPPSGQTQVFGEALSPDLDNPLSYTLKKTPVPGSVLIYRNGLRQTAGADYEITGSNIVFKPVYSSNPDALVVADYLTE